MRGYTVLLAAAALLLPLLATAAFAADVPLQEGAQVELTPGINYTVPGSAIAAIVEFPGPVKVKVYTGGSVLELSTNNVTLAPGAKLEVGEKVYASVDLLTPVEVQAAAQNATAIQAALAATCADVSYHNQPATISVSGPAQVTVQFQNLGDPYLRYYIVAYDSGVDVIKQGGWWRKAVHNTLANGVVFDAKTVTVEVPAGSHTLGAAVSTFGWKWRICLSVVNSGGSNGGSSDNPTTTTRPPTYTKPPDTGSGSGSSSGVSKVNTGGFLGGDTAKWLLIGVGAILVLFFVMSAAGHRR